MCSELLSAQEIPDQRDIREGGRHSGARGQPERLVSEDAPQRQLTMMAMCAPRLP